MFTLRENTFFGTPKTQEELNKMLEDLGQVGVLGAMYMHNFIADQYKQGNVTLEEKDGIQS
jgi:hypothetical protein